MSEQNYLLYYMENTDMTNYIWLDHWCNKFGLLPIIIDRVSKAPKSLPNFKTVQEAIADDRFSNLEWVWLHPAAKMYLDEYNHPNDGIIYCIGSDFDGFDGMTVDELLGTTLKLRQPVEREGEWYASLVVPIVAYDRFLYLNGRRK